MRRFFYAISNDATVQHADNKIQLLPKLNTLSIGNDISLTDAIIHHWCRVLRATVGDEGVLFDGFGGEYHVQLQSISKKQATATLLAANTDDRAAPIIIKIGLVMSRGERMDYAIQKATELGVSAIQLLSSQHGEVNLKPEQVEKKLLHWQQVAIAACEQCGLNRPPLILAPQPLKVWLQQEKSADSPIDLAVSPLVSVLSQDPHYHVLRQAADLRLMLSVPGADQPLMPAALLSMLAQNKPYLELLIGPEGGFSQEECQQAEVAGFAPWQIGTRVLRTETAPVVALATLHALINYPPIN